MLGSSFDLLASKSVVGDRYDGLGIEPAGILHEQQLRPLAAVEGDIQPVVRAETAGGGVLVATQGDFSATSPALDLDEPHLPGWLVLGANIEATVLWAHILRLPAAFALVTHDLVHGHPFDLRIRNHPPGDLAIRMRQDDRAGQLPTVRECDLSLG